MIYSCLLEKANESIKSCFPIFASLGIYFLALNSPMYQQMNQPHSVENEIKSIPLESFKQLIQKWFFSFSSFISFDPAKIAVIFLRNGERSEEFHKTSFFLHLCSNHSFRLREVGKQYLNRTLAVEIFVCSIKLLKDQNKY